MKPAKESTQMAESLTSNNKPNESGSIRVQGHIKIFDPISKQVIVDKRNAIHHENFSIALASGVGNVGQNFISEMAFGNGGTRIDPTGIITYLTPNSIGANASLYNQTYYKIIDPRNPFNLDSSRNFMEVRHVSGAYYSDLLVSCLLDFGEPEGQPAFDAAPTQGGNFVFDELGLKSYDLGGENRGLLLTHVIFHPVQKALNRLIQIDYTIRIQSLTSGA
jgi:hypothetical protein